MEEIRQNLRQINDYRKRKKRKRKNNLKKHSRLIINKKLLC